ncbi:DUF4296 domain-containing protein [Dokdonia sp.]|uniref:DUF4296 domain-containing protein n=1 Tax=Dokdonia sp. TaxID=2024995 RepID=UPI0032678687
MKSILYFLLVCVVISCQDIPSVEKPANLIERTTMQEIIYDVAIINGARGYDVQKLSKYGVTPETYIFDKYNIDSLQFAENVTYYSSDIESYKEMYLDIQKRVDEEFLHFDSIAKVEKKVKDSLRTEKAKSLRKKKDSLKSKGLDTIIGKKEKKQTITTFPSKSAKEVVIDSL